MIASLSCWMDFRETRATKPIFSLDNNITIKKKEERNNYQERERPVEQVIYGPPSDSSFLC